MQTFEQFLKKLGQLHDARITSLTLNVISKSCAIEVDDIYSNSLGSLEYLGPVPAQLVFKHVAAIDLATDSCNNINIYGITLEPALAGKSIVSFLLWPGGKIVLEFMDVEFPAV